MSVPPPMKQPECCALILTALAVECSAVCSYLTERHEELDAVGTVYEVGTYRANDQTLTICVAEIGAGNSGAASAVERAINRFEPQVALFVGVAGGIKDVRIGDVVFATKVYGYASGKETDQGFEPRAVVGKSSYKLVQRARAESRGGRSTHSDGAISAPKAIVAPIAAGEKVVASTSSDTYKFLRRQYGDAVAVEMEGFGFLEALDAHTHIDAGVVRGISDLLGGKSEADAAGSQELASRHAAAFALQLLSKLLLQPNAVDQDASETESSTEPPGESWLPSKPTEGSIATTLRTEGLPSIKNPFELDEPNAFVGIDDADTVIPAIRLQRANANDIQAVAGIAERLRRHTPIVIFVGPQLCGKTWLVRSTVEHLRSQGGTGSTTSLHHEIVHPRVVSYNLPTLDLNDFTTARFRMYALWAQRMVRKVVEDRISPHARIAMQRDPNYSLVFAYMDNLDVAHADVVAKFRQRSGTKGADFLALEWSVLDRLRLAGIPDPELILLLEVEDLHDLGRIGGSKRESAESILGQFWAAIRGYAEASIGRIGADSTLSGTLRILVTTRHPEVASFARRRKKPVTSISGFSASECLQYVNAAGFEKLFPGEELNQLVEHAHEATAGYAWFVARFLRTAAFLRRNSVDAPVAELCGTIESVPYFWYWHQPFLTETWEDMSEAADAGEVFPLPNEQSLFLQGVSKTLSEQTSLVAWYRNVLSADWRTYSETDEKTYLLALLRAGLIQLRPNDGGFEVPNRIIAEHFSPEKLDALLLHQGGCSGSAGTEVGQHDNL